MAHRWRDNGLRYGLVTRILHWSMAVIIFWQFSGLVINRLFGRSALTDMLNGTHGSLGAVILLLAAIRAVWGFHNLRDRPPHEHGPLGFAARAGHTALYMLLLIIPAIALVRAAGSEWGWRCSASRLSRRAASGWNGWSRPPTSCMGCWPGRCSR